MPDDSDRSAAIVHMQVSIFGILASIASSGDVEVPIVDLQSIRRQLPAALADVADLDSVRGLPSQSINTQWSDRFVVLAARSDAVLQTRTSILVQVQAAGGGVEGSDGEGVLGAQELYRQLDERLLISSARSGVSILNASNGVSIVTSVGAVLALPCKCFEGAWTVSIADESCPVVRVDMTGLTVSAFVAGLLVPIAVGALIVAGHATFSGGVTVGSVALHVLDVVSDMGFAYQLARESYCETPALVSLALSSVLVAMIVNGALSVFLLRCWQVPGMDNHIASHWSNVASIAFLSFFGVKALDLLSSGLFHREGLSLYRSDHLDD